MDFDELKSMCQQNADNLRNKYAALRAKEVQTYLGESEKAKPAKTTSKTDNYLWKQK